MACKTRLSYKKKEASEKDSGGIYIILNSISNLFIFKHSGMQKGISTTSPEFQLAISSASSLPVTANTSIAFSSPEILSFLNISDPVSASAYSLSSSTAIAALDPVSTIGSSSSSSSSSNASSHFTSDLAGNIILV